MLGVERVINPDEKIDLGTDGSSPTGIAGDVTTLAKNYKATPVTIVGDDCLKRNELSASTNGIISGWIGQTYYDLSDPEILKALMKNIPDNTGWIHIIKSIDTLQSEW